MMGRGFIFTIDALFALCLVVIMAAAFTAHYSFYDEKEGAIAIMDSNASDVALVEFYTGRAISHPAPVLPGSNNYWKCRAINLYSIVDNDHTQGTLVSKKYCYTILR